MLKEIFALYQNPQCIMYFLSDTWKSNKLNSKIYKENE